MCDTRETLRPMNCRAGCVAYDVSQGRVVGEYNGIIFRETAKPKAATEGAAFLNTDERYITTYGGAVYNKETMLYVPDRAPFIRKVGEKPNST